MLLLAKKAPTFIDVFAGCGGLSYGLMTSGWKGLFAIERDTNAFASLKANLIEGKAEYRFTWPRWLKKIPCSIDEIMEAHYEYLFKLRGKVDLLVGGPPCQGFSSAGRRIANDPRNQLTDSYLKFVSIIQPKLVLIENVRGITTDFVAKDSSGDKINYAKRIIEQLSVDYNVFTELLDTSLFGVPQKRKRFFIVALRKDIFTEKVESPFQVIERQRPDFLSLKGISIPVSSKSAISDLEISRNGTQPSKDTKNFNEIAYKGPMTGYQRLMNNGIGQAVTDTRLARHNQKIKDRFQKLIELCHADGRLNVSISPELRASFGLKKCAIRVMDPDNPSPTITSMPDDLIHYSEARTLTVRENARLQSFPDSFVFKGKYTTGGERRKREVPRFTQVANAVPPLIAEAIGRALLAYLYSATTAALPLASQTESRILRNVEEAAT